mgnify:CR=1 FL=1
MKNYDEQIAKAEEQIKQLNNKKKRLISEQKQDERKKRTKRLIERGAILESVIGSTSDFTNEQIKALLIEVFSSEFVRSAVEKLREQTERNENPLL